MVVLLVLLYALVRWGSGREIVFGLPFVAAVAVFGTVAAYTGPGDAIGGAGVLFATIAYGAAFRYRADVWRRQLAEIRSQERVGLARELHDTVAHHVSAIAVQAQAGQALAANRPDAAIEALQVIEGEASRTLAEMRAMVRVLREGVTPEFSPQPGVADLAALARADGAPIVDVSVIGDLEHVPQPVDTAVYRLAQESLTNAVRHARQATRITIRVVGEPDRIRLRVVDDGETDPSSDAAPGYGLIGMTERAQLLGGTLKAGPAPSGGWQVLAELPVGAAT
jgi:signal transduction histidine kinase